MYLGLAPYIGFSVFVALIIWLTMFGIDPTVEIPSIEEVSECVRQMDEEYCFEMFKQEIEEEILNKEIR